jgi:hypothetical protein
MKNEYLIVGFAQFYSNKTRNQEGSRSLMSIQNDNMTIEIESELLYSIY